MGRTERWWLLPLALVALTCVDVLAGTAARVQGQRVNLRKGPTIESAVVTVLDRDTAVEILKSSGAWAKVKVVATGAVGYVSTSLILADADDDRAEPSTPATTRPARPAAPETIAARSGARTKTRPTRPAVAREANAPRLGVRLFGQASYVSFAAKQSFQAILGSSSGQMLGLGAQVRYGRAFLQVSLGRYSKSGERVFQFEDVNYPLGIKDTIKVTPLVVIVGARLLRRGPLGVYVGGGIGSTKLEESSDFEDPSEGVNASFTSYHAIVGVEYRAMRWARVALEGHYASVPKALGAGGVSSLYSETNLGGMGVQLKVLVGK